MAERAVAEKGPLGPRASLSGARGWGLLIELFRAMSLAAIRGRLARFVASSVSHGDVGRFRQARRAVVAFSCRRGTGGGRLGVNDGAGGFSNDQRHWKQIHPRVMNKDREMSSSGWFCSTAWVPAPPDWSGRSIACIRVPGLSLGPMDRSGQWGSDSGSGGPSHLARALVEHSAR